MDSKTVSLAGEGRVRYPGSPAQSMHADASVTGSNVHPAPDADLARGLGRIVTHVLGINAVFCIDAFSSGEGTTLVVPGSHARLETELPPDPELYAAAVPIEAEAGSVVLWDVNLWHCASKHSGSHPRRAVFSLWRCVEPQLQRNCTSWTL